MSGSQEEEGLEGKGWNRVFTFGNTDAKEGEDAY